jgi:DNA-binding NarL/FixJ family response regulator
MSIVDCEGEPRLVLSFPLCPPHWPESLSPAERAVAELVMNGASNAEIATARGTSSRTVANQIATIFQKLGVSSRVELAARIFSAGR